MLYDSRQRPQSVYLKDRLYLVYNGDATPTKNSKASARPMLITYHPGSRTFLRARPAWGHKTAITISVPLSGPIGGPSAYSAWMPQDTRRSSDLQRPGDWSGKRDRVD